MHSTLTLGFVSSLIVLAAAHPFPTPVKLDRRVCHFDDVNPLVIARNADNVKRQTLSLGSTRPADLTVPLDEVWDHTTETRPNDLDFANYGYDQVIAGKGKINYCVRWESNSLNTEANRADTEAALQRSFQKWIDVLAGYDDFPYSTVEVSVVGYAADKALLQGSTAGLDVYDTKDSSGVPECDPRCGRFFHQDGDYSECPGGADRHYDLSLWLTDGFEGGAGGDWGQRIATDYFIDNVDQEDLHILLHELGHTFALDDFYDWTPTGVSSFIMLSGSSKTITPFDSWMARDWWTKAIKSRYSDLGGFEEVVSAAPTGSDAPTTASYSSIATPDSSAPVSSALVNPLPASSSPAGSALSSYAPAPVISWIPTLSSVVSALPTAYFPAPGNGTILPTESAPCPTGGTGYPTVGTAYTTGGAIGSTPCPASASSSGVSIAPAAAKSAWGHRHRWGKARLAEAPIPQPAKHEWRD